MTSVGEHQARARATVVRRTRDVVGMVEALAAVIDARDRATGDHGAGVTIPSMRLALAMSCTERQTAVIGVAARLHDLGKVAMSDALLNKPDRLSPEEHRRMEHHPDAGADVLVKVPALRAAAGLVRAHHERWDGTGYPRQLAGVDIPLGARVIAVVDAYSAMTTRRGYRDAMDPEAAVRELRRCAGTQFDPQVVAAFAAFPVTHRDTSRPRNLRRAAAGVLIVGRRRAAPARRGRDGARRGG